MGILKSDAAIFEILIFWPVSGHTSAENSPFLARNWKKKIKI